MYCFCIIVHFSFHYDRHIHVTFLCVNKIFFGIILVFVSRYQQWVRCINIFCIDMSLILGLMGASQVEDSLTKGKTLNI